MKKYCFIAFILLACPLYLKAQTAEGYIIQIDGNKVYLDLHSPDVKAGDMIAVYIDGGVLVHPKTKKRIVKEPELAGHIRIESVYETYSVGKALANVKEPLKDGMTVRKEVTAEPAVVSESVETIPSPQHNADGKITVVIAPAEVNDVVGVGFFGGYVADMLMTQLLLGDKVRLLDRSVLNAQMDEIQLSGDYIDPATAIRRGRIAGARYIIQVTMQKPDVVNVSTGIPLNSIMGAVQGISGKNLYAQYASNVEVSKLKASVSLSTRVVDLETGEVLFMCSGSGKAEGKSQLSMEYGALGGAKLNGGIDGFKQTVTGKAIEKAFGGIGRNLNQYFDGKITDKKVVGSIGSSLTYGEKLTLRGNSLYLGTTKLEDDDIQSAFADNAELYFQFKKGKKMKNWSWLPIIIGAVGVGAGAYGINENSNVNNDYGDYDDLKEAFYQYIGIGAVFLGTGIYLNVTGGKKMKAAVSGYNSAQDKSLGLVVSGNGLGLRLTF